MSAYCNKLKIAFCLTGMVMVVAIMGFVAIADAEEGLVVTSKSEYGFLTGYGITHKYFGATRTQVQTWDAIARFGYFLSDEVARGSWYQGRHELLVELPYHMAVDHNAKSMVGGYLLGSWKFTGLQQFAPYIFAGGGVLFVDLGLPTMGSKMDFSYQGGFGLQYFIKSDLAIMAEYRYHHISNAGTATPNEPLNSSKFLFGLSYFR